MNDRTRIPPSSLPPTVVMVIINGHSEIGVQPHRAAFGGRKPIAYLRAVAGVVEATRGLEILLQRVDAGDAASALSSGWPRAAPPR